MKLHSCSCEQFMNAMTDDPADKFAKTFVAKANMQNQWEFCVGAWDEDNLMGAIITTLSKGHPIVANLQLLHTFNAYRGRGVGKDLCYYSLRYSIENGANYFRVSADKNAIPFYEKIGFKMIGKQKSGSQLSMFKIEGHVDTADFSDGYYSVDDPIISKAVNRKGKGGCVEIFC